MASKIIVDQLEKTGGTLAALTLPSANATANQYIKNDGAGALSWATLPGGGKIGQVLQAQKTDTFTSASASFIDITDLTVTITPSAATSKVLVISNVVGIGTHGNAHIGVRLMRDSTPIAIGDADGSRTRESSGTYINDSGGAFGACVNTWLDEPATTSAVVYKVQGWADSSYTFYVNRSQTDADSTGYGRPVSSITVMEVLA
jgi:hypothetical protein